MFAKDWFKRDVDVTIYLLEITGFPYSFAQASSRKWGSEEAEIEHGDFYQLMPDSLDDGFFDWYCETSPYMQFYTTWEECTLIFVYQWMKWRELLAVQNDRRFTRPS
jgi:hypothetical protein